MEELKVEVAIIGSGTAGLNALSQVKPSGKSFVLINGGEAGTTCARVGCMPSKAIIQIAEDLHRRGVYDRMGIEDYETMQLNVSEGMEYVRDLRDNFVDRVLSYSTDKMGDEFIETYARFVEPNLLELDNGQRIRADKIIIATGSTPIIPAAWMGFRDRIITTDEFFEQEDFPSSMAVIGLGVIGLELGQSLARIGVEAVGIDQLETIGGISDPVVAAAAIEAIGRDLPLWLGQAADVSEEPDGRLRVTAGKQSVVVDKILASLGRRPNLDQLNLTASGAPLDDKGVPIHDPHTAQVADLPIFIAGDASGQRPILHEAGDEGKIAGCNAVSEQVRSFKRRTPLAITFTDPNIVSAGVKYSELNLDTAVIGEMKIPPVGRAQIMGKNRGVIRVYADKASGRLLGTEMVSVRGENLAHLMAWCIQQEMTVGDVIRMPFYHPVMEEALQAALKDLYSQVDKKNPGPLMDVEPV